MIWQSGRSLRVRIGAVGAGHDREQRGHGVIDRQREDRDTVERPAGRHQAPVGSRPRDGFSPTMPFSPAGTRPDPAVSVPSAKRTSPAATATAEPELDPPGIDPRGSRRCAACHRASARRRGR